MQHAAGGDFENADERGVVHGRVQLSSNSDSESDEGAGDDGVDTSIKPPPAEVTALCWCAASVGVARFLCAECRIEVFEVPVCMVAGEIVRRRCGGPPTPAATIQSKAGGGLLSSHSTHGNATGSCGDVRIVAHEDIPPSLLWLVRYLQVHQPQVLLPHPGSEALGDLIALVAEQTPVEVIRLSATTAFCGSEALPRLAAMYPAQEQELAARFHADRTAMMCSMAALLHFVAAVQSNVADVVERDALHALYLDDACAEALQITRTERHPSSGQGRGRAKEGLSLRGLLSTAQSSVGRAMLRQWIALPCCDAAEIETRQSVVAFFADPLHHDIATRLRAALHKVRSTTHVFTLMRSGRALHKHYVSLYQTMRGIITVQELLATVAHEVGRLYVLLQSIRVEPLRAMVASLDSAVIGVSGRRHGGSAVRGAADARQDQRPHYPTGPTMEAPFSFDSSVLNAVRICDGADTVLDELRVRFRELQLSLQVKAEAAFAELPWTLRARVSLRCVYTAPHGYLLCVPAAELEALLPAKDATDEDNLGGEGHSDDAGQPASWCSDGGDNETTGPLGVDAALRSPTVTEVLPSLSPAERVRSVMADSFGWRLHHATEAGEFCFKSAAMEELDTWVGDLQRRVQQREEQVRRELDTSLLYNSLHLLRPTRALGELDCLLSFARVSSQEGWCRPEIVVPGGGRAPPHEERREEAAEGILEIEDGWHPLLSRHVGMQQLIPFSLHLRTSTDRVCLVLGVNGSGKSVFMGAVAQIVFLAHLGCHVPAATARLSLVSSIFAPSSSLFASSSSVPPRSAWSAADVAASAPGSFYGECVALHRVLHFVAGQQRTRQTFHNNLNDSHMAGRALVLLDEFGRGTSPEDGCALLKATLQYFADGGESRGGGEHGSSGAPLVLCATHLVEMLDLPRPRAAPGLPTVNDAWECGAVVGAHRVHSTVAERTDIAAAAVPVPSEPVAQERQHMPGSLSRTADAPLPLEWVKIYEMETHATYAADKDGLTGSESLHSRNGKRIPLGVPGDSGKRLPVDVTPTYQPVCLTPHAGPRRQQDWERYCSILLAAGPAIGRQCGLDEELLSYWETTLCALYRLP